MRKRKTKKSKEKIVIMKIMDSCLITAWMISFKQNLMNLTEIFLFNFVMRVDEVK